MSGTAIRDAGAPASKWLRAVLETEIVLCCFEGVQDVRMYFGSWNEWSRDDALPIESGLPFAQAAE